MKRESDKCLLKGDHPIGVDNVMYKLKVLNWSHDIGYKKSKQKDLTVYRQYL